MAWGESSVTEERLRFVVAASRKEKSVRALCQEFQISRQTGYTWLNRYKAGGSSQVVERSRRPQHSPARTPAEGEQVVVELRRQYPDWGAPKLAVLLGQQLPGAGVCQRTVHRILVRHHLLHPEDRQRPALGRFERSAPNELWQMDFKGSHGLQGPSPVGPLSVWDDHSRYLIALEQLGSTAAAGVQRSLKATFERVGWPEALLVDHGTPWWNAASPWGLTELSIWIWRQGVRLLFSGVRHPQTQGKVERMHGALLRAIRRRKADSGQPWLDQFRHEYNHVRPHAALSMAVPATRWQPSPRFYQSQPREWDYPSSVEVRRLGGEGQLSWRGQRWEVSGALRRQLVGIQIVAERALVYFCNAPVRELDLRTKAALPLAIDLLSRSSGQP